MAASAEGEGAKAKAKRSMVAIDDSECSNYALRWALTNLREAISSSPLVIFNVQPFATTGYMTAAAYGAPHALSCKEDSFLSSGWCLIAVKKMPG